MKVCGKYKNKRSRITRRAYINTTRAYSKFDHRCRLTISPPNPTLAHPPPSSLQPNQPTHVHPQLDEIDETELSTDNAEVYLFQWLASTQTKISQIEIADLKTTQTNLEKTLLKIISHPEGYPPPGRAIRELSCMRIVGDFKSLSERDASKIAAFSCIGDVMAAFGSQRKYAQQHYEQPNPLLPYVPSPPVFQSNPSLVPLLRYQALITLRKSLTTTKRAVTDSLAKDIQKQMRSLLMEKLFPVQRGAFEVLINLYTHPTTLTLPEIDTLARTSGPIGQIGSCNLIGHILASTQIERVIPVPDSPSA
ncbi:hypothetical protein BDQ17DRAFT_1428277 [Cyathus striatus]|nr:hypothetical protein BDQ17DRAFT_1428277 [Cyathus striatus]